MPLIYCHHLVLGSSYVLRFKVAMTIIIFFLHFMTTDFDLLMMYLG